MFVLLSKLPIIKKILRASTTPMDNWNALILLFAPTCFIFCCEKKNVKFGVQETDAEHEMEMKLEMKSLSPGKAARGFFLVSS